MLRVVQAIQFADWEEMLMPTQAGGWPAQAAGGEEEAEEEEEEEERKGAAAVGGEVAVSAKSRRRRKAGSYAEKGDDDDDDDKDVDAGDAESDESNESEDSDYEPPEEPEPTLASALHLLTTQLLCADILASGLVRRARLCAQLGDATARAMPGYPFNAATWPGFCAWSFSRALWRAPERAVAECDAGAGMGQRAGCLGRGALAAAAVSVWSAGGGGGLDGGLAPSRPVAAAAARPSSRRGRTRRARVAARTRPTTTTRGRAAPGIMRRSARRWARRRSTVPCR